MSSAGRGHGQRDLQVRAQPARAHAHRRFLQRGVHGGEGVVGEHEHEADRAPGPHPHDAREPHDAVERDAHPRAARRTRNPLHPSSIIHTYAPRNGGVTVAMRGQGEDRALAGQDVARVRRRPGAPRRPSRRRRRGRSATTLLRSAAQVARLGEELREVREGEAPSGPRAGSRAAARAGAGRRARPGPALTATATASQGSRRRVMSRDQDERRAPARPRTASGSRRGAW